MTQPTHTVSTDTALRVVANPRRRSILSQLIDGEETEVTTDTLVDRLKSENPPPKITPTHANSFLTDVHHTELPKLAEANVIEYDPRSKTIRYTPNERVERVLQFVTEELE